MFPLPYILMIEFYFSLETDPSVVPSSSYNVTLYSCFATLKYLLGYSMVTAQLLWRNSTPQAWEFSFKKRNSVFSCPKFTQFHLFLARFGVILAIFTLLFRVFSHRSFFCRKVILMPDVSFWATNYLTHSSLLDLFNTK